MGWVIAGIALVALGAWGVRRRRARRAERASPILARHRAAAGITADALGLAGRDYADFSTWRGTHRGHEVRLGASQQTLTASVELPVDRNLPLSEQWQFWGVAGTSEVDTGDASFDQAAPMAAGAWDRPEVAALLGAEQRAAIAGFVGPDARRERGWWGLAREGLVDAFVDPPAGLGPEVERQLAARLRDGLEAACDLVEALAQAPRDVRAALARNASEDPEPGIRSYNRVVSALHFGPEALGLSAEDTPMLVEALDHGGPDEQLRAMELLGRYGDARALAALGRYYDSLLDNPRLRGTAQAAAEAIRQREVVPRQGGLALVDEGAGGGDLSLAEQAAEGGLSEPEQR